MRLSNLDFLQTINESLLNLGITSSNLYNIEKLKYRTSSTLVGSNLNIDQNDIWHTLSNSNGNVYNYDYTASNLQLSITSTSDGDRLGSTGISTVIVNGVNSNFDSVSEVIVLTGTTQKLSTNNFQSVNSLYRSSVMVQIKARQGIFISTRVTTVTSTVRLTLMTLAFFLAVIQYRGVLLVI